MTSFSQMALKSQVGFKTLVGGFAASLLCYIDFAWGLHLEYAWLVGMFLRFGQHLLGGD
jgi:ABC-type thiamin/hydroxymethylpyrimidine transport system permease subunit